jgi:hypothetical protein
MDQWNEEAGDDNAFHAALLMHQIHQVIDEDLSPEQRLGDAVVAGDAALVTSLLLGGIDINLPNQRSDTFLDTACICDQPEIVSLLLSVPGIDVNAQTHSGMTALMYACQSEDFRCARLLLEDPRTNPDLSDRVGRTALQMAARGGHTRVVKWWIALGKEIDPDDVPMHIGAAKLSEKPDLVAMLERFRDNPERTRWELRKELGMTEEAAAGVFAPVIFHSDGLLRIREASMNKLAKRFMGIMVRLPMELQMFVSHLVAGSARVNISHEASEPEFRRLARKIEMHPF